MSFLDVCVFWCLSVLIGHGLCVGWCLCRKTKKNLLIFLRDFRSRRNQT